MRRIDCSVAATVIMLGLLGCGGAEPSATGDANGPVAELELTTPQPTPPVPVSEIDLPPPRTPLDEASAESASETGDDDAPGSDETETETETETAPSEAGPADSLAPILPAGPEPGSPEADAELAALLDESTLTQEEFDKGFRGGGPNVRDDQLVFGGGARKQPVISFAAPKLVDGKFDAGKLKTLAQADERKLIGCHAMALANDPKTQGSLTLRLRFDDAGAVTQVEARNAGAALGAALIACVETVAKGWRSPDAAKATVELGLTLSVQ